METTQGGGSLTGAGLHWAEGLAGWGIPREVLAQARESPWSMPPGLASADPEPVDTPSRRRGVDAVPADGAVLDVGCGSGRAGLALLPPAGSITGVDVDPAALRAFVEAAAGRGVEYDAVEGVWPDVAGQTAVADVVVAHHVVYNAPELGAFVTALGDHARHRVVLELSHRHPMSWLAPLWRRFWQLERPAGPGVEDALAVLAEVGIDAHREDWVDRSRRGLQVLTPQERVAYVRSRLCLTPARDAEIAEALVEVDLDAVRTVATIWWEGTALT